MRDLNKFPSVPNFERYQSDDQKHRIHAILEQRNIRPFLGYAPAFDAMILSLIGRVAVAPNLSRTSIRLFIVLAEKLNRKTGFCYPGVHSLATELGVSPQAIRKACRELEKTGFIHVEQNASTYRTNLFFLDFRKQGATKSQHSDVATPIHSETGVSGSLISGIFGETAVADLNTEDRALLDFAAKRSWAHD